MYPVKQDMLGILYNIKWLASLLGIFPYQVMLILLTFFTYSMLFGLTLILAGIPALTGLLQFVLKMSVDLFGIGVR